MMWRMHKVIQGHPLMTAAAQLDLVTTDVVDGSRASVDAPLGLRPSPTPPDLSPIILMSENIESHERSVHDDEVQARSDSVVGAASSQVHLQNPLLLHTTSQDFTHATD